MTDTIWQYLTCKDEWLNCSEQFAASIDNKNNVRELVLKDTFDTVIADKNKVLAEWKSECFREATLATDMAHDRNYYQERTDNAENALMEIGKLTRGTLMIDTAGSAVNRLNMAIDIANATLKART